MGAFQIKTLEFYVQFFSIKDRMEQLHFIITNITKGFSQLCDGAMTNTCKRPYYLACQKICWTYIIKLKRKKTQNEQIIHRKVYCFKWRPRIASIIHKYSLSKFLYVKRDVNFLTIKSIGRKFLTFGTTYGEKNN